MNTLTHVISSLSRILLICVFVGTATVCPVSMFGKDIVIDGKVTTAGYKEMANVKVRVWRSKQIVATETTDSEGQYKVEVPEGSPIDSITFDPSDLARFGPGTVNHLSGRENQRISTVIYEADSLRKILEKAIADRDTDTSAVMHQLLALERVYSLETSSGVPREKVKEKYGEFFRSIAIATRPESIPKWNVPLTHALTKVDLMQRIYFRQ